MPATVGMYIVTSIQPEPASHAVTSPERHWPPPSTMSRKVPLGGHRARFWFDDDEEDEEDVKELPI